MNRNHLIFNELQWSLPQVNLDEDALARACRYQEFCVVAPLLLRHAGLFERGTDLASVRELLSDGMTRGAGLVSGQYNKVALRFERTSYRYYRR
jgi:hypothetical protein